MFSQNPGVTCSIVNLIEYRSLLLDSKFCENSDLYTTESSALNIMWKTIFKCLVNEQIIEFNQDNIPRTGKYQCCVTAVGLLFSSVPRR